MLRTCIYEQVAENLVTKTGLRKHSFHSSPDEFSRSCLKNLLRRGETLSARISGVTRINPVGHLLSTEGHFLGVDHDDVVTAVHVRREPWLVLAAEDKSNSGRKTAESQIGSINDDPLLLYSLLVKVH